MESTRSVKIELDGAVGLAELEEAAMAFARSAPGELVAEGIESMIAEVVDIVVGPFGVPWPAERQIEAPWARTRCASHRGFRRRGFRPKPRLHRPRHTGDAPVVRVETRGAVPGAAEGERFVRHHREGLLPHENRAAAGLMVHHRDHGRGAPYRDQPFGRRSFSIMSSSSDRLSSPVRLATICPSEEMKTVLGMPRRP